MIEVFKTNVGTESDARELRRLIGSQYPGSRISFDLDDCDKVLRVEGSTIDSNVIIDLVSRRDYRCSMLE